MLSRPPRTLPSTPRGSTRDTPPPWGLGTAQRQRCHPPKRGLEYKTCPDWEPAPGSIKLTATGKGRTRSWPRAGVSAAGHLRSLEARTAGARTATAVRQIQALGWTGRMDGMGFFFLSPSVHGQLASPTVDVVTPPVAASTTFPTCTSLALQSLGLPHHFQPHALKIAPYNMYQFPRLCVSTPRGTSCSGDL